MKMKIRKAKPKDLDEIQILFEESIFHLCSYDYTPEQIAVWSSSIKRNRAKWLARLQEQFFLVAIQNDEIIGFGSLEKGDYIDLLYVHKDYAKRGVASTILAHLEKEASKEGQQIIYSDVSKTALPFFEYKGFTIIQENKNLMDGVEIINYHMKKS